MSNNTDIKLRSATEIFNTMKKMGDIIWYNEAKEYLLEEFLEKKEYSEKQFHEIIQKMREIYVKYCDNGGLNYFYDETEEIIYWSRFEALRWVLGADFQLDFAGDGMIKDDAENIFGINLNIPIDR